MFGWLTGGIGKAAESIGNAVNKNIRTLKGDKAEAETHIHDEQMAVLSQYAAEFAGRPPKTKWDSFVDGLNRLPRPLLTFGIIAIFFWAFVDPGGFINYMSAMEIVPDTLWTLVMLIVGFFFGGRFVKEDLAKPKLTDEQRRQALEIIKKRSDAITKDKAPDIIVAVPAPKPEPKPVERLPDIPTDREGSAAIDAMIADLIRREAGYVNDPDDSGGPTNFGITAATLSDWRDSKCDAFEIRALTKEEATKIYRANYYFGPRIDALPPGLQTHVFDIGVNSGPRTAIRLLQVTLNSLGCDVVEDGITGPATVAAACSKPQRDVNRALAAIRVQLYHDIVASKPEKRKFLAGWLDRAKLFSEGTYAA